MHEFWLKSSAIFASEIHTIVNQEDQRQPVYPAGQHVLSIIFVIEEEISGLQGRGKTY